MRRPILVALCLVLLTTLGLCERPLALDLGTFNIRRFPEPGTDLEAVARAIAELDADAFAVQEIVEVPVFRAVLIRAGALSGRRYGVALESSHCPRRDGATHVGVVYDLDRLELVESRMLGEYTCPEGQPAGMLALLRADDGRRFALASVHFTSGDRGKTRAERTAQWAWIVDELPELRAELGAPVIVGGDFNSTGYLGVDDPERRFIDALIDRHGLQLPTGGLACSMYWKQGGRWPVSLLDHVVVPRELAVGPAEALGMCAELACVPQDGPPRAWQTVSDHCPVRVPVKL